MQGVRSPYHVDSVFDPIGLERQHPTNLRPSIKFQKFLSHRFPSLLLPFTTILPSEYPRLDHY